MRAPLLALALALVACQPPSGTGPVAGPRDEPEPVAEPAEVAAEETPRTEPSRRPPAGGAAIRWVDASRRPEIGMALRAERSSLIAALDESLGWFEKPSSQDYFPVGEITHERAWASAFAFRELVDRIDDPWLLEEQVRRGRCTPGEKLKNDRDVKFLPEGVDLFST